MLVPKHHTDGLITLSWLQVFGSAQWARTGEGGEQQDHTQKQRSEKCGGGHRSTQAKYAPEARFFGPQTPETLAVSLSPCPHSCKELGRFSKLATSYYSRRQPSLVRSGPEDSSQQHGPRKGQQGEQAFQGSRQSWHAYSLCRKGVGAGLCRCKRVIFGRL